MLATIVILVVVFLALMFWVDSVSVANIQKGAKDTRDAKLKHLSDLSLQYGLTDTIAGGSMVIGINATTKQVLTIIDGGIGYWTNYSDIAGVQLTPIYHEATSGTSSTVTNRSSQIMGAGIGALAAGPLGAAVGGLSGSKATQTEYSTQRYLTKMELQVRMRREDFPLFKIEVGYPMDVAESLAARIANIVEMTSQKASATVKSNRTTKGAATTVFQHVSFSDVQKPDTADAAPVDNRGWWEKTFGA